ncbi:MAG: phosphoribosylamine--glycine ligase [Deltaproteobacteria bacterium RIFCSPLOWO2_02_FULL_46_8]|nr:MAG: phosphoribosylamine--glycine ligase [Deltaproteobacteria bacterium RIFCSPLOWO2_02_FULL_46_8]
MKILVIGSGGREHALVWKLSQSPKKPKIFCAPGNAGIASLAECVAIFATDIQALLQFAKTQNINLTVVGPEVPLAGGIVDLFKAERLSIFGPTKSAAQLESSKIFTKEFCKRHEIPQAPFAVFTDSQAAKEYLNDSDFPVVIKADGLAQGKGVVICDSREEAETTIDKMLVEKKFGEASRSIVIEDFLVGDEVSFLAIVDGEHILPLASAKDHKRLLDRDQGPNTGGMGAYSPAPLATPALYEKVMERIMIPTVKGMADEGNPFVGILYAGLMISNGEPQLLEFNVRFGDPEAQVILPRLRTDLVHLIQETLNGNLRHLRLSWEPRVSVCVVMASEGYPEKYATGYPIEGLQKASVATETFVFHAGTQLNEGHVVTAGGRVLCVTALGDDLHSAAELAYGVVSQITWPGCYYRKDIGL